MIEVKEETLAQSQILKFGLEAITATLGLIW